MWQKSVFSVLNASIAVKNGVILSSEYVEFLPGGFDVRRFTRDLSIPSTSHQAMQKKRTAMRQGSV